MKSERAHEHTSDMSIFTDSISDIHMSSMEDAVREEPDIDSMISDHNGEEAPPKDYWFGRKYFECVLAQSILQTSPLYNSIAHIDSQLESAKQRFPFARSLARLRADGLEPLLPVFQTDFEHDSYRIMMSCIGAVVRKGDRRQKAVLLAVLRQHEMTADASIAPRPPTGKTQSEKSIRGVPQKVQEFVNEVNQFTLDLGQYATALQKHSDKRGVIVTYKVDELSKVPPRFQATAVVGDGKSSPYIGIAKTKKQARHEAAKEACLIMDIQV